MKSEHRNGDRARIERVVTSEFPDNLAAADLIHAFLRHRRAYDREFVEALVALATSPDASGPDARPGQVWELRGLAAMMLQQQFLHLPADDVDESLRFLGWMGLLGVGESSDRIRDGVLKEGYTSTEPMAFLVEFRRHMERLARVLSPIGGARVTSRALRDFVAISRDECCKLSLARYLFRPDEVAEEILSRVRRSTGESAPFNYAYAFEESDRKLASLPYFEAGLLEALCDRGETFWVGDQTSPRINALVEQPILTVVMTVKPPGSSLEIEIKRAGRRRERPLSIVHDRNGRNVPPSHRLDGGSSADTLQWESGSSACLAKIYRLVHGSDAPISIVTAITYPDALPVGDGPCQHLVDYFSDPSAFGNDSPGVQRALRQSVASFSRERGAGLSGLQGQWAEALEFLQYAMPAQSLLAGSSSFRLDLLCRYLSANGVRYHYGEESLPRPATGAARRFADSLLEEVLGVYRPPDTPYASHESYLEAAFSLPENRARADRVHASLTRRLGTFWATILAIRAYSFGESFVGRNVGLKSVWERGRWTVRIIFMDHDNLHIPTAPADVYNPARSLPGTIGDESHVMGHIPKLEPLTGAVDYLGFIYRIDEETADRHRLLLRQSMARAYRKTQNALVKSAALKRIISPEFTATGQAWDSAVAIYLQRSSACPSSWSAEANASMESRGIPADLRACYLEAIERFAPFLERQSFLYTGELNPPAPKPSGEGPPFESSSAGATGPCATSTSTASAADTTTRRRVRGRAP